MTPEMKVCFAVRKIMFTIAFIAGEMKQSFCFDLLIYYFCFDEIIASADSVSRWCLCNMYHPKWNFISANLTARK